jgi:hypothetical protein
MMVEGDAQIPEAMQAVPVGQGFDALQAGAQVEPLQ